MVSEPTKPRFNPLTLLNLHLFYNKKEDIVIRYTSVISVYVRIGNL